MYESQKAARIRVQQKNRGLEEKAKKEWQKEEERLLLRQKNMEDSQVRRHNLACMMLCSDIADCGMHRMRSFGKRFKLNRDGNLWNNMPSLCSTHEFTEKDEAESEKMIRTQRKNMIRAGLARTQTRLGTAMTVSSSGHDPHLVELQGSRRPSKAPRGSRSKTSMM